MAAEQEKLGDLVKAHQLQGRKVRTRGTFGVVKVSSLTEVGVNACLELGIPLGLRESQLAIRDSLLGKKIASSFNDYKNQSISFHRLSLHSISEHSNLPNFIF